MSRYRLTPQAVDDLFEIWTYIAGDNLEAAEPTLARLGLLYFFSEKINTPEVIEAPVCGPHSD
jgi:hypothetical protein